MTSREAKLNAIQCDLDDVQRKLDNIIAALSLLEPTKDDTHSLRLARVYLESTTRCLSRALVNAGTDDANSQANSRLHATKE